MARRAELPPEITTVMFLKGISDHPWATARTLQACSGLDKWEVKRLTTATKRDGLIETASIPTRNRPAFRYALLPAGATRIGDPVPSLHDLREALLRCNVLDVTRLLLSEWAATNGLGWALSPFTVHKADVLGPGPARQARADQKPDPYRSIALEALAAVPLKHGYLYTAVLIDPGDIDLRHFYHQFRSFYRWTSQDSFRWRSGAIPALVLVAANNVRLYQLMRLWREFARYGRKPLHLYATTHGTLIGQPAGLRLWRNEKFDTVALFSGVSGDRNLVSKPTRIRPGFPGHYPPLTKAAEREPLPATHRKMGLVAWSSGNKFEKANLIRIHLGLTHIARRVLYTIGRFPLLKATELAEILHVTDWSVYKSLKQLKAQALIKAVAAGQGGYALTGLGVALLAGQAGLPTVNFASLCQWPLVYDPDSRRYDLSVDRLTDHYAHTRLGLDLLLSLVRLERRDSRFRLLRWEQESLYRFFDQRAKNQPQAGRVQEAFLIPDAVGTLLVCSAASARKKGPLAETEFLIEVDRDQKDGLPLYTKLKRYYEARGSQRGTRGWLPRVLIVVERDNEARAQALRRRFQHLNRYYGMLDVLVTRVDLIATPSGQLDLSRKVWRRPDRWTMMTYAFNGLPFPGKRANDPDEVETFNLLELRKAEARRQRRSLGQRRRWERTRKAQTNDPH